MFPRNMFRVLTRRCLTISSSKNISLWSVILGNKVNSNQNLVKPVTDTLEQSIDLTATEVTQPKTASKSPPTTQKPPTAPIQQKPPTQQKPPIKPPTEPTGPSIEVTFDEKTYKLHGFEDGPEFSTVLYKSQAEEYIYQMELIRRMENAASALYREKIIRGFCHLYSGQEACCVGAKAAMRDIDHIITAYRCHGWCYMMGISLKEIMAELTGRKSGIQRGKGGSMHMYTKNFYGGNGIVGAQVPLGVGVALYCKYKGTGGVCLALYGDGASNQGQIFEAFNIANLNKLPAIFVCENNLYGMGTAAHRSSSCTEYYARGQYLPGIYVDGMNVLAVRTAIDFAIAYASEFGPLVIEMETYRYTGHSMSDPGTSYRKRDEIQEVRQTRDPIAYFKQTCLSNKLLTEEDIKKIDAKIKNEIDDAVEFSRKEPEPELKELTADLYSKSYEQTIRGKTGQRVPYLQINKGSNH